MGRKKRKKSLVAEQGEQLRMQWQWGPGSAPQKPVNEPVSQPVNNDHVTTKMKVKQVKEVPGLMACIFEHEVTKTTAEYEWTGPTIPTEMWHQVLAFFKWTYDTTKSESQVRLYANAVTQQWRAWAYPQKANLGMAAHELDTPATKERRDRERAQFSDAEGWLYYGTVHHHCSSSAFQSSTDERNESSQDGIHITVGNMDKNHYSIDARLYQSGRKILAFRLSQFWNISDLLEQLPDYAMGMLVDDSLDRIAKYGMGKPAPADTVFPQEWKDNIVYEARSVIERSVTHVGGHKQTMFSRSDYLTRSAMNIEFDGRKAMDRMNEWLDDETIAERPTLDSILIMAEEIRSSLSLNHLRLLDIMIDCDCTPEFFLACLDKEIDRQLQIELKESLKGNGKTREDEKADDTMDYEGGHYFGHGSGFGIGG